MNLKPNFSWRLILLFHHFPPLYDQFYSCSTQEAQSFGDPLARTRVTVGMSRESSDPRKCFLFSYRWSRRCRGVHFETRCFASLEEREKYVGLFAAIHITSLFYFHRCTLWRETGREKGSYRESSLRGLFRPVFSRSYESLLWFLYLVLVILIKLVLGRDSSGSNLCNR